MKLALTTLTLLGAFSALADAPVGIICQEDNRINRGGLREVFLTSGPGGYVLQSQNVTSLNSADIKTDNWATHLECRMDEKTPLAFCKNPEGSVVILKERREVFIDSLEVEDKKKTNKYIDISLSLNGVPQKALSFSASHCQVFGGDA